MRDDAKTKLWSDSRKNGASGATGPEASSRISAAATRGEITSLLLVAVVWGLGFILVGLLGHTALRLLQFGWRLGG